MTIYYKMRAIDPSAPPPAPPRYITWVSTTPDFVGAGYWGGSPTPVDPMLPDSATVVAEYGYSDGGGPVAAPYTCPSGVLVLDLVRITGADAVDVAQADVPSDYPTVGFVASKPSSTSAIVQSAGELAGFVGLTPGATYYLSETPGQITTTAPVAGGSIVQAVGWARNTTTLFIEIERDYVQL